MATGTVLSFDALQGYGFVAADDGAEDVFLHIRAIGEEYKDQIRAGTRVSYVAVRGDRGLKATQAHLLTDDVRGPTPAATGGAGPRRDDAEDLDEIELIAESDLRHQVTERLLGVDPTLTGGQILNVRQAFIALAREHGWLDG